MLLEAIAAQSAAVIPKGGIAVFQAVGSALFEHKSTTVTFSVLLVALVPPTGVPVTVKVPG
jgi:uncharacterized protein (UPF0261 family)